MLIFLQKFKYNKDSIREQKKNWTKLNKINFTYNGPLKIP